MPRSAQHRAVQGGMGMPLGMVPKCKTFHLSHGGNVAKVDERIVAEA